MSFNPVVSVIMPVFNNVLYIEEAVYSILNQTFSDFELIIIDDGSTDGTSELLKTFTDFRIKTIYFKENKGVSIATNEGFKLAKGKYIARMDGDDVSVPERLEKQVNVLNENSHIFICGGLVKYFGGSNEVIPYKEKYSEILAELLLSCSICMGASMFRRKELANYFYDETRISGEDYYFWTQVAWLGEIYNLQTVLLLYRVHDRQASTKHKSQQVLDDISIRLQLFKKLNYDTNKFSDSLVSKMLLLNQPIKVYELKLFLKWLKTLVLLNSKSKIFSDKEFGSVLNRIRRNLIFKLYFKKTNVGIDKKWRLQAFSKLPIKEMFFVIQLKIREKKKTFFKNE
ncbi:hypothetical protein APS56_05340 [Pseudalgibacter alginicilyticus]|uniref:Glycosyltransferase 2-like domain-containing protein n=1 Tax=Pseudalgibacter alginicilyticus TaxID=1736674 RepID=A0A0P0D9L2_9FLAO|nr:glycosyltransferase family 2 protein [Pseudalgibacter alginicilyticus]ALJ04597.1 hypothetical protein APS56_05340 [Pseudalgibacter alginicilyticus]